MRHILIICISFALSGCLPLDTVMFAQPNHVIATDQSINKFLKIKTCLYKGNLTYYTETILSNAGNRAAIVMVSCGYYNGADLVGRRTHKLVVVESKSNTNTYERLFYIEQRYNWVCDYYDTRGVEYRETVIRMKTPL